MYSVCRKKQEQELTLPFQYFQRGLYIRIQYVNAERKHRFKVTIFIYYLHL